MLAKRSAPACGYATDEKAVYREQVWRTFKQSARTGLRFCRALLMPSSEALEIAVAERWGCSRENIVAVDHNVAIAATISRKYPGITAWGCDAFDAVERAVKRGIHLDLVHFDMTGNLSPSMVMGLQRVAKLLRPGAIIVLNTLKGREPMSWMKTYAEGYSQPHCLQSVIEKDLPLTYSTNPTIEKRFANRYLASLEKGLLSDNPYEVRRRFLIQTVTGWRIIGLPKTYTSGRAPMQWSAWRSR